MTASAGPALKQLHAEFGDQVTFLTLYVREAHPGECYPQVATMEEKLAHSRDYQARDGLPWTVAVDDPEGSLHRMLDPRPNAAYLMGTDGNVAFRSLWSNDTQSLRDALAAFVSGRPLPVRENELLLVPMIKGMGTMEQTLEIAGDVAKQDVLRQVPPMYAMARIASLFEPLPPLGRGIAATAVTMAGMAALVIGARRLLGHSDDRRYMSRSW